MEFRAWTSSGPENEHHGVYWGHGGGGTTFKRLLAFTRFLILLTGSWPKGGTKELMSSLLYSYMHFVTMMSNYKSSTIRSPSLPSLLPRTFILFSVCSGYPTPS